jgi:hypothetical protein
MAKKKKLIGVNKKLGGGEAIGLTSPPLPPSLITPAPIFFVDVSIVIFRFIIITPKGGSSSFRSHHGAFLLNIPYIFCNFAKVLHLTPLALHTNCQLGMVNEVSSKYSYISSNSYSSSYYCHQFNFLLVKFLQYPIKYE